MSAVNHAPTIVLPYRFDTAGTWRTILKGAFAFNALLISFIIMVAVTRPWPVAIGLVLCELMAFWFTRMFFKYQEGSIGTLRHDRVDVSPNILFWFALPGPRGSYLIDRFSAIQVEFRSGPIQPGVLGGPNEVVWLKGKSGTPNVALALVKAGAGRSLGEQLAAHLGLPIVETGAPRKLRLQFG
jgi:hypothetical protein